MSATAEAISLETALAGIVGDGHLLVDETSRDYYSRDLSYLPYERAAAIAQPGSVEQLADVVRTTTAAGYAVIPRGGGMSYTRGYTPDRARSVIVDMRRLDRIVEINTQDMYVIVECGCTWKSLVEALAQAGVRTPYYGPLSGMYATVGGALSQNSLFLGSGDGGTAADSLLGLEVVLADGSLIRTGSWAHRNSVPFYRHFGPDITGVFTADTGAFGFKARAALRLVPLPDTVLAMSFAFDGMEPMLAAQIEQSRLGITTECYGFDPYYNRTFESRGISFRQGVATLREVMRRGNSRLGGIADAARVALKGRSALRDVRYSLHMNFEGAARQIAKAKCDMARAICEKHGGREISNTLPTIFKRAPFDGVGGVLLGTDGEIWLPVHGFAPLSRVQQVAGAIEKYFADNRERMERHGIRTSYLTCYAGNQFLLEPSVYWYDEVQQFRRDRLAPDLQGKWDDRKADPEKRAVALAMREALRDLMADNGCCHLQLARYYPFHEMMNNDALWTLLGQIKGGVDPAGLINPGALGLPAADR